MSNVLCSVSIGQDKIILRTGISGHRCTQLHKNSLHQISPSLASGQNEQVLLPFGNNDTSISQSTILSIADEFLASDGDEDEVPTSHQINVYEGISVYSNDMIRENGDQIILEAGDILEEDAKTVRDHLAQQMEDIHYCNNPLFGFALFGEDISGLELDESGGDSTVPDVIAALEAMGWSCFQ